MGIFDKLFGAGSRMPGFEYNDQSPDTANIIGEQQKRAALSPDEMLEKKYSGAPKAGDIQAQVAQTSNFNKALGMASPDQLNDVLTARAQKSMDADLAKAKRLGLTEAYGKKAQRQMQAGRNDIRQNQIAMEVEEGRKAAADAKKKARNSTLGSILGVVGQVGGTVAGGLVGGPMGAQVGSQVGGGAAELASGD